MASTAFEMELGGGLAEALGHIFANVEELSAKDVHTAMAACDFIQNLFKMARASIEGGLRQGVEARSFASRYEQAIVSLDSVKMAVGRVLDKLRGSRLPALGEELISRYEDLDADLASLRQFLLEAVTGAKKPSRPIDWEHVREAKEAYARGEMKPFRRTAGTRGGN